jgi:hypothetical protein
MARIVTDILCVECGGEMLVVERRGPLTIAACEDCSHSEDWYEPLPLAPDIREEIDR